MKILCLILIGIMSVNIYAAQINLKAEYNISGEYLEDDDFEDTEWELIQSGIGDYIYSIELIINSNDLPLIKKVGPAVISINQKGELRMSVSIGDDDAGLSNEFQLPVSNDSFDTLPEVKIVTSGGDYASGYWSFDGEVIVSVTE